MVRPEKKLNGLRVLVTRPEGQARQLSALIAEQGGQAIAFPTIEIRPIDRQNWDIKDITDINLLMFISPNAVTQFVSAWHGGLPEQVFIASVGKGTTQALQRAGWRVDYQPQYSIGSEGLLALPALSDMADKKVLIVRGKGGREHLAETLKQRGAQVRYVEVYERRVPSLANKQIEQALLADCMVCTSVASVKNLCILLQAHLKSFYDKPMLVCSQRIKEQAQLLGFQTVEVSKEASDQSIVAQLLEMEYQ